MSSSVFGGVFYPELIMGCTDEDGTHLYKTNDPWIKSNVVTIYPWVGNKVFIRTNGYWNEWCETEDEKGELWYGDQYVSCIFDITKAVKSLETQKYHSIVFDLDFMTHEYRSMEKTSIDGLNYEVVNEFRNIKCEPTGN